MRIIICDRCKKEIDPKGRIGYVSMDWRGLYDELTGENPFEKNDFCEDCMRAIAEFVSAPCERVTECADDPEEEGCGDSDPEWKYNYPELPESETKKLLEDIGIRKRERNKIDKEKVLEMYRSGKKISQISKETGYTYKGVFNIVSREKQKNNGAL